MTRSRTWLALMLFAGLFTACPGTVPQADDDSAEEAAPEPFDEALAEELQSALETARDEHEAPGVAAAVQMPGTEPWVGVAGLADLDTGEVLTPAHRFKIASVTKTFVAAVVLQLAAEGNLDLDDRLGDHHDGFALAQDVTLRQLLMHTSGVPDYGNTMSFQTHATEEWTDEELLDLLSDSELAFEPGTDWLYSNSNYVLLGLVVEAVTGERWDQQVASRLLVPAGLHTLEAPLGDPAWGGVVPGYWQGGDQTEALHPTALGASGAMVGGAEDVARWGTAWLGGSVLDEASAAQRWEQAFELSEGVLYCGLGIYAIGGQPTDPAAELFHNGELTGYSAWMGHHTEGGISLAVLTNSWPGTATEMGRAQDVAEDLWTVLGWGP